MKITEAEGYGNQRQSSRIPSPCLLKRIGTRSHYRGLLAAVVAKTGNGPECGMRRSVALPRHSDSAEEAKD